METLHIAVVAHDYPTPGSNAGAFVKARVDLYRREGHSVSVHSRTLAKPEGPGGTPDVIAAHYPLPEYVIPFCEPFYGRVPIIAYLHGAEAIHTPDKPLLWGLKAKLAVQRFLRHCHAAVTESRWMRSQILGYLRGTLPEIAVIPNPVDDRLFALSEHRTTNGVCIRGRGRKYGTDLLGPISKQLSEKGIVVDEFTPTFERKDLPEVLSRYGFFVAPSRLEGQGLMACEALATGMPVVSTKVGGIPEFVTDPYSLLVDRADPNELARAIEKVSSSLPLPHIAMSRIRDSILSICGSAKVISDDLALFRNALSPSPG